jgi:hypothetical protein
MTTSKAVGSTFTFLLASDINRTVNVDFGDGTWVPVTIGIYEDTIRGTLKGQTVKVYGDKITLLNCEETELTSLDVTKATSLLHFWCGKNPLGNIDVTHNGALTEFWCQADQLTSVDVTHNPELSLLDVCYNKLTSLDVTQNKKMDDLECFVNQFTTLDVSQNTTMRALFCGYNQLTSLDVSHNTNLYMLGFQSNKLTSVDITKNVRLNYLECDHNQLTTLDISQNTALSRFYCANNKLTFLTLPLQQATWTDYTYAPQAPIAIAKSMDMGTELDLSNQLTVNGVTTVYNWKTKGGITLVPGTDYTITNGKTIFTKTPADSVYCEMTNITFPGFKGSDALKSTCTKITSPVPTIAMTTINAIGSTFTFLLASDTNRTVYVDFGDGRWVPETIGLTSTTINGTLAGQTIKVYGAGITLFNCENTGLTSLDVTKATSLTMFWCDKNQLSALDITQNTALIEFWVYANNLTSLDVTHNAELSLLDVCYNKLTTLDVTHNKKMDDLMCFVNQLTTLDVTQNAKIRYLTCGYNQLTDLDVTHNPALYMLEFQSNKLTSVDITKNLALSVFSCENNQLTTLDISQNTALTMVLCDQNKLTFLTLPLTKASWTKYIYAPQDTLFRPNQILKSDVNFNYSSQSSINNAPTTFVFYKDGGIAATNTTGKFTTTGSGVYRCEMTNTAFPGLTLTSAKTTVAIPAVSCSFGTPLTTTLPTTIKTYNYVYVLGAGGPNLSNVSIVNINWDLPNKGLWQFSMNTKDGKPNWYIDLRTGATHYFASVQPSITLSGTGLVGLDGSYYAAIDNGNFVMVSKTGGFTIYFSNSATAPSCKKSAEEAGEENPVVLFPNPFVTSINLRIPNHELVNEIYIIDQMGRIVLTLDKGQISENIQFGTTLSPGMYIVKVVSEQSISTYKIIKK